MKKLKALAAKFGCTVEDDRDNATLYVHAPDGNGWDEGQLTALLHCYGSRGSYLPKWRQEAIEEALVRLGEMGAPTCDTEEAE
jgi:hypothetical protein